MERPACSTANVGEPIQCGMCCSKTATLPVPRYWLEWLPGKAFRAGCEADPVLPTEWSCPPWSYRRSTQTSSVDMLAADLLRGFSLPAHAPGRHLPSIVRFVHALAEETRNCAEIGLHRHQLPMSVDANPKILDFQNVFGRSLPDSRLHHFPCHLGAAADRCAGMLPASPLL